MKSTLRSLTFDCADPVRQADFWAAVLAYEVEDADAEGALIVDPQGQQPRLLFIAVPEGKTAKNRIHFDLRPDTSMNEEVTRLEKLGASVHQRFNDEDGVFTVMLDPEGNEFCVERGS